MSTNGRHALEITSLHAGYGRYDVVRDLDLFVGEGEAVALLGPNGAGKTTVLRSIMGLVKHRRGSIRVMEQETVRMPVYRIGRGLAAIVPEGRRLFLDQSVEDNLLLGALHLRRDSDRVRRLLDSVYALFPALAALHGRSAAALSGGQQQMVAIGRMLMSIPRSCCSTSRRLAWRRWRSTAWRPPWRSFGARAGRCSSSSSASISR